MDKNVKTRTFKDINDEYTKLFKDMNIPRTVRRLTECVAVSDGTGCTPQDIFQDKFIDKELLFFVNFKPEFAIDDTEEEKSLRAVTFETKIREARLSYLKLVIPDNFLKGSKHSGYIVWADTLFTEDELFKIVEGWAKTFNGIEVTAFRRK